MIKVSAGLCLKIGGANYSSKGGLVHPWADPFTRVPVTGKFKESRIQQEKITRVPAQGFFPEAWLRDVVSPKASPVFHRPQP